MSARSLPVRPDLDQLKHQAKDLLKAYRDGDREASADFAEHHPKRVGAERAKLVISGPVDDLERSSPGRERPNPRSYRWQTGQ